MTQTFPFHTPLLANDLRKLGIPEPWAFGMGDKTRFGELDALAHINNTAYLRWLESFRISYFEHYGLADYSRTPPRLVLKSIAMDFKKEMLIKEPYIVTGRTSRMRNSSFTMEYAVWSGDLRATGSSIIVWLDQDGQKLPIPEAIRDAFVEHDGTIDDR